MASPTAVVADKRAFFGDLVRRWNRSGCAICGKTGDPEAEAPYRVEIHSLHPGHGRHDSRDPRDYLGLGGAFLCNHHEDVQHHRIDVYPNQQGQLAWVDRRPDATPRRGVCHALPQMGGPPLASAAASALTASEPRLTTPLPPDAGSSDGTGGPLEPSTVVVDGNGEILAGVTGGKVTVEVLPARTGLAGLIRATDADTPSARQQRIRELVLSAEQSLLDASLLLYEAWQNKEAERLEVSWSDYVDSVGLAKGTASKMILVASTFEGRWRELPAADQAQLSVGRLYQAAKLAASKGLDAGEVLHRAVSTPSHHLEAERRDQEPSERRPLVCAECGQTTWHTCTPGANPD